MSDLFDTIFASRLAIDDLGDRMERHNSPNRGARLRAIAVLIALVGGLFTAGTSAEPSSASAASTANLVSATKIKGTTKCRHGKVERCVWLETYWVSGQRKIRAASYIEGHNDHLVFVDNISLRTATKRVTTRNGVNPREVYDELSTHGTHRDGAYHAVAKFCWKRWGTHSNYTCGSLKSWSAYFKH